MEITHKLDEKRKEGAEIAEELIKADTKEVDDDVSRAVPVPAPISGSESGEETQQTESEEDTVDEAPSIVDEAMSKEGTSQSSAVITVSVEIEAVKDGLAKVDEVEEPVPEKEKKKKIVSAHSGRKLSPFKALGLLGLFFLEKLSYLLISVDRLLVNAAVPFLQIPHFRIVRIEKLNFSLKLILLVKLRSEARCF